jgi:hypothetical protein
MNLPWLDDLFSEKDLQDIQAIIERSREDEPTFLSVSPTFGLNSLLATFSQK